MVADVACAVDRRVRRIRRDVRRRRRAGWPAGPCLRPPAVRLRARLHRLRALAHRSRPRPTPDIGSGPRPRSRTPWRTPTRSVGVRGADALVPQPALHSPCCGTGSSGTPVRGLRGNRERRTAAARGVDPGGKRIRERPSVGPQYHRSGTCPRARSRAAPDLQLRWLLAAGRHPRPGASGRTGGRCARRRQPGHRRPGLLNGLGYWTTYASGRPGFWTTWASGRSAFGAGTPRQVAATRADGSPHPAPQPAARWLPRSRPRRPRGRCAARECPTRPGRRRSVCSDARSCWRPRR